MKRRAEIQFSPNSTIICVSLGFLREQRQFSTSNSNGAMNNTFIPQAVEIVKQAIDYDNLGEYEKALGLYQKSLEYFITGLKYEQNPASKKIISDKVVGYMNRAEEIKKSLADSSSTGRNGASGGAKTMSRDESKGKDSKEDDEKSKLRGALSSSIVSEKPNVKWDDVAGLEGAKEALKEGEFAYFSLFKRGVIKIDTFALTLNNSCYFTDPISSGNYLLFLFLAHSISQTSIW